MKFQHIRLKGEYELPLGYYLILLLPIFVFVSSEAFIGSFGSYALIIPADAIDAENLYVEVAGRYNFFATLVFFSGVSASIFCLFVVDLVSLQTARSIAKMVASAGALVFIVYLVIIKGPEFLGSRHTHQLLGFNFFEIAFAGGEVEICKKFSPKFCQGNQLLGTFKCSSTRLII